MHQCIHSGEIGHTHCLRTVLVRAIVRKCALMRGMLKSLRLLAPTPSIDHIPKVYIESVQLLFCLVNEIAYSLDFASYVAAMRENHIMQ